MARLQPKWLRYDPRLTVFIKRTQIDMPNLTTKSMVGPMKDKAKLMWSKPTLTKIEVTEEILAFFPGHSTERFSAAVTFSDPPRKVSNSRR
jgi:hypothetical protein